ncbi:hypothetical protein B9479_008347 [Cryptococcus floricola]|uniref:Uncharacterized protein n=1 Tax=Cryptococcus floricola TaxID=2591691 RepID=A0A5D3ALK3_9TREE|nr:hypothetical protein B9479_008347 [Cryptococcus floricola]
MTDRSELDRARARAINKGYRDKYRQKKRAAREQEQNGERSFNILTPDQMSYYSYGTQYGGDSSMSMPPSQEGMNTMSGTYNGTMSNQPSSMSSYNPDLDEESALAQHSDAHWWESSETGDNERSKK